MLYLTVCVDGFTVRTVKFPQRTLFSALLPFISRISAEFIPYKQPSIVLRIILGEGMSIGLVHLLDEFCWVLMNFLRRKGLEIYVLLLIFTRYGLYGVDYCAVCGWLRVGVDLANGELPYRPPIFYFSPHYCK